MKNAVYILSEESNKMIYNEKTKAKIAKNFNVIADHLTRENCLEHSEILKETEVIFSGWGGPIFNEEFLQATPNLEAIFYGAGTMKKLIKADVWGKGIKVTNAHTVNAIPVAEYTLSQILFSLKNGWQLVRKLRNTKDFSFKSQDILGAYMRTVGIISLSSIGYRTIELLKPFDLDILVYDPFVREDEAKNLGISLVSLEELFKNADVVSLHTPLLEETRGMITGKLLRSMKKDRTFINTARGAIVREEEMIEVLKERSDLTAILDVTYPEPPDPDSLLFTMDNVVLTPHIAGSAGKEVSRMGHTMFEEAMRFIKGEQLLYEISKDAFSKMA